MKILKAQVYNFSSYKEIIFEFTDQGLTLISGPTGSGKSTLCDIIPWILFGRTAKNGSVEEVRSWGESAPTDGMLSFEYGSHSYYVRRIRGDKANDLFYGFLTDYMAEGKRGKDLNDTQKQINQLIGMDVDTYLMGSYYHEFSQVATFFVTTAKVRRSITEQLADLSLAKTLQEKTSAYSKELKKELQDLKQEIALKNNTLQHLKRQYQADEEKYKEWYDKQAQTLTDLKQKAKNYDKEKLKALEELFYESTKHEQDLKDRAEQAVMNIQVETAKLKADSYYLENKAGLTNRIAALKLNKCSECGSPKNTDQVMLLDKQLYQLIRDEEENVKTKRRLIDYGIVLNKTGMQVNPYTKLIEQEKQRKNTYLEQIEEVTKRENPYTKSQESASIVIQTEQNSIKMSESFINDLLAEQSDVDLLISTIDQFRGAIISRTIDYLQTSVNTLLSNHFDSEIRVSFDIEDADKLDVGITKDGNQCSFTQLSKGQRQILQLCFSVAVMKCIANYQAVSFNCLFFDEVLSGMDDSTRVRAFGLLEKLSLEYQSLFVVDHSDAFKSMFTNKIEVGLKNGKSQIEKN